MNYGQSFSSIQVPIYSDDKDSPSYIGMSDSFTQQSTSPPEKNSYFSSRPSSICSGESNPSVQKDDGIDDLDQDHMTNIRLTALENSLMDLLNQIAQKQEDSLNDPSPTDTNISLNEDKIPRPVAPIIRSTSTEEKSRAHLPQYPVNNKMIQHTDLKGYQMPTQDSTKFNSLPRAISGDKDRSPINRNGINSRLSELYYSRSPPRSGIPTRIPSAPGSRNHSRRSSLDRSPPRDFFKKMQRSILKKTKQ